MTRYLSLLVFVLPLGRVPLLLVHLLVSLIDLLLHLLLDGHHLLEVLLVLAHQPPLGLVQLVHAPLVLHPVLVLQKVASEGS